MVGQRKKISAFPVSAIYFIEIVHDKWCLDKSAGKLKMTSTSTQRSFVKRRLNSGFTTGPKS